MKLDKNYKKEGTSEKTLVNEIKEVDNSTYCEIIDPDMFRIWAVTTTKPEHEFKNDPHKVKRWGFFWLEPRNVTTRTLLKNPARVVGVVEFKPNDYKIGRYMPEIIERGYCFELVYDDGEHTQSVMFIPDRNFLSSLIKEVVGRESDIDKQDGPNPIRMMYLTSLMNRVSGEHFSLLYRIDDNGVRKALRCFSKKHAHAQLADVLVYMDHIKGEGGELLHWENTQTVMTVDMIFPATSFRYKGWTISAGVQIKKSLAGEAADQICNTYHIRGDGSDTVYTGIFDNQRVVMKNSPSASCEVLIDRYVNGDGEITLPIMRATNMAALMSMKDEKCTPEKAQIGLEKAGFLKAFGQKKGAKGKLRDMIPNVSTRLDAVVAASKMPYNEKVTKGKAHTMEYLAKAAGSYVAK